MDRARKDDLGRADRASSPSAAPAVLVATHDVEFAAAFAERVVLLGDGVVIADGPAAEVLSGGWYFATEVARVLDLPGVDHPEQGAARCSAEAERDELAAGQLPRSSAPSCSAASPGTSARGRRRRSSPWSRRWPRWRSPAGSPSPPSPTSSRPPTSSSSPATRSAPRPASRSARWPALVSNFWFGQGPWTPWQMAGWGLCGVLGAALAPGGRNAGRLTLAAVCGFAGIAYGALLNFSLMATYGGELSLERFLALEARAIPFDAAHAIGNVAFALVAGPAMVRMLVRFRERFEWRAGARAAAASGGGAAAGRCSPSRPRRLPSGRARPTPAGGGLAGVGAEQRRRLRRSPGDELEHRDHRLGDARPRGGRAQPARRRAAAATRPVDFLRRNVDELEQHRRPRPHDPRPRGRRRRPALLRRPRPGLARCSSAARDERLLRGLAGHDRLRGDRPARRRRQRRPRAVALLAAQASRTTTAAGATCRARRATPTSPAP